MISRAVKGPIEAHPEYKLIVDANNMIAKIDDEIGKSCDTHVIL